MAAVSVPGIGERTGHPPNDAVPIEQIHRDTEDLDAFRGPRGHLSDHRADNDSREDRLLRRRQSCGDVSRDSGAKLV